MHRHHGGAAKAPLCFTAVVCVHIPSCDAGSPLRPGLPPSAPVSSAAPVCQPFFFFPHRPIPADSSSETHGGGVRCQTSCSLPPSRAADRSLWKNYSDICMCHSYKAPGTYPPARQPTRPPHEASPFQPAACLRCPSSLHLRQSFLQLLNMANCARREAHFI